jgi:signal peptidase I
MPAEKKELPARGQFFETANTIFQALLIALVIRTFLFQPFNIPSGSMEPTLLIGDYLFVSKFSYGYSRYSFPFSPPLFSGRVFGSNPNRGDIVVFRHAPDDFIKRVIGLPGDRIQLTDSVVSINGTPVEHRRVEDFVGRDPCQPAPSDAPPVKVPQFRETLPNGVSYNTLQCASYPGFPDTTSVYTVPPDHFFMMGDNRENSEDSRFPDVSYVPAENLIGRAQVFFFSIGGGHSAWEIWQWPRWVRWSRFFGLVR